MEKACQEFGIRMAVEGDLKYLLGVQLQGSSVPAPAKGNACEPELIGAIGAVA
jgi:hypothetical protein